MAISFTHKTCSRLVLSIVAVICFQKGFAQINAGVTLTHHLVDQNELGIQSRSEIGSNGINKSLIFNDFWSQNIVSNQIEQLPGTTRLGISNTTELKAVFRESKLKSSAWSPMLRLSQNQIVGVGVQRDLVALYLQGNGSNKTIDLDKTSHLRSMRWADISFGFEHINKDGSTRLSFGVSYAAVQNDISGSWTAGRLITSPEGDSVSLVNSTISYQNPNNGVNGNGLGLVVGYHHVNRSGHTLKIEAHDIGFISWSDYTRYENKTDVVHEGIRWRSNRNTSILDEADSLFDRYYTSENVSRTFLPFRLNARYLHRYSDTKWSYAQLRYRHLPGNLPEAVIGMKFRHAERFQFLKLGASVGGYALYGVQVGLHAKLLKRVFIDVDLRGAESLISEKVGLNWMGNGRLYWRF